jgi:hypothetical protein
MENGFKKLDSITTTFPLQEIYKRSSGGQGPLLNTN